MLNKAFNSAILNSWFGNIVILFSSVVAIPIVITSLSVEEINVWFLLITIVSLSQSVLFGFNGTFARFIAYVNSGVRISDFKSLRYKKNIAYSEAVSESELSRVFYLMKKVYAFLAIMYALFISLLGYWALLKPMSILGNGSQGWISFLVIVTSTTLIIYLGHYQVFLEGINKIALVQRVTGIVNLVGVALILGTLLNRPSLLNIVSVYQIVAIVTSISVVYFSKKSLVEFKLSKRIKFDKDLFLIVWDSAWKSGITTIIANAIKHGSALLVAQWFPAAISATFLFTKKIFDVLERFAMSSFQARLPVIAKHRGRGNFEELIPYLKQTQHISYGVFLAGYILLTTTGESVLAYMGSNVALGSVELIILFSFATLLTRWGGMMLMISNQANNVIEHINASVASIVFFMVIYFFHDAVGINIFPIASILASMVVVPIYIKMVYPYMLTTYWHHEKNVFLPALFFLLMMNALYYVGAFENMQMSL